MSSKCNRDDSYHTWILLSIEQKFLRMLHLISLFHEMWHKGCMTVSDVVLELVGVYKNIKLKTIVYIRSVITAHVL